MIDERANLPSASGIERIDLCPGSWRAEQQVPADDGPKPDADRGTRIHALLAGEVDASTLPAEEVEFAGRCEWLLKNKVLPEAYGPLEHADTVMREKRLWMSDSSERRLVSGKADLIAVYGMRALIVDYKTGRGEVTAAHSNLQLRALVAILSDNLMVKEATVAIVQPDSTDGVSIARYNDDDIAAAREELRDILAAAEKPDAKRVPSVDACRYCSARAICPEARELAITTPVPVVEFIKPEELAMALTEEKLVTFLEHATFAENVIEACRNEAKRRLSSGQTVGGWTLKPGTVRETVVNPQRVFDRFCDAGGSPDGFMSCVSITKGKLKDAVRAATAKKGKELDAQVEVLLQGCVESKQSAPSLSRK